MKKKIARYATTVLLVAAGLVFAGGCLQTGSERDKFQVNVKFVGGEEEDLYINVKVILSNNVISSDEHSFGILEAGEEATVNLFSERTVTNDLAVFYTVFYKAGEKHFTWQSEAFSPNADYRIDLVIDGDGNITHNSCRMPC